MRAPDFLKAGLGHMQDRATTYDKPEGERSMRMTVDLVNVLLADKLSSPLSEEDGWNIMQLLKLVRSKQGEFKADNYEDGAAYAGLAGEAAHAERSPGPAPAPLQAWAVMPDYSLKIVSVGSTEFQGALSIHLSKAWAKGWVEDNKPARATP